MSNRPINDNGWRSEWYDIIFEADSPKGKTFDVVLLIAILGSLLSIMLETVESLSQEYRTLFRGLEWFFTVIFTLEYITRLLIVEKKRKYIFSFYGMIDLLSIIPTYLAFFLVGAQYFLVVRSFRLIRVFRVLKMVRFLGEARMLTNALKASRHKITVFLIAVICIVFIMGALMYIVEGKENGFANIPVSIYWCIVTLTTVGYGDITPLTPMGKIIASVIMILGYGLIAVPTGIVTSEMTRSGNKKQSEKRECDSCGFKENDSDAVYCKKCGNYLE